MKRIAYSLIALAIAAFTFSSCEDVPSPFGTITDPDNGGGKEVVDPTGDGSAANPFNVAAAIDYVKALGADVKSDKDVYIKGVIVEVKEAFGTQYGNAQFSIADSETGKQTFVFYRGLYLGNQKYTDDKATNVKVGDNVVICGKVIYYKGSTPETSQGEAYVVSINGEGGDTPTPSGETLGTKENPLTIDQALEKINALADGAESDQFAFVKGKVVKVTTNQTNFDKYGNLNYLISEDGTENGKTITVYSGDGLDGAKFTGIDALAQGDEVIVYGKLYKYVKDNKVTPEIAKGNYLVSLVKGSGGGGDTPSDDTLGTKENPLTIAQALEEINKLADNGESEKFAYVKGKVVKVTTNQSNFDKYGNLNYLISENGEDSNTITVYSGDGLNGEKFTGIDALAQGDEVIVYGKLLKYVKNDKVTPEIAKGNYLVSLVKGSGGGGTDTPATGTLQNPLTASQAYDAVAAMAKDVTSTEDYYVKGKICSVKYYYSADFGTATFNISDNGSTGNKEFTVYGTYYKAAGQKWVDGNTQIAVGDEVVVCGKVVNYGGNTPEFANKKNYVVTINGQ